MKNYRNPHFFGFILFVAGLTAVAPAVGFGALVSAVLPTSRSAEVGTTVTAFATIINTGADIATACSISPATLIPATFSYQTTDPATNALIHTPDTPTDIAAGGLQTFVVAFTPTAPFNPTDVQLSFDCRNSDPAPIVGGLNTLLLSASSMPVPDIVALAATVSGDGAVHMPDTAVAGAFSVATVNVGSAGTITAAADTGGASLPVTLSICETNPGSGACLTPATVSVTTTIGANETQTFAVFIDAAGEIAFEPSVNRIFVRFRDSGGSTRGSTSVAIENRTLPTLSINDATVSENAATAVFTVSLSETSPNPVSVDVFTTNGTAVAGSDFSGVSTTLAFAPGETRTTVAVPISNDTAFEGDENFTISLSNAINADISDPSGLGTILDDDIATVVDKSSGINLRVRPTSQSGVVEVRWTVSSAVLSQGANDFELQLYVGGAQQWFGQLSTDEPTEAGFPVLLGGVPDQFCFRMVATINATPPILGSGTSGNKDPCL